MGTKSAELPKGRCVMTIEVAKFLMLIDVDLEEIKKELPDDLSQYPNLSLLFDNPHGDIKN